ncbi:2-dehydropantoate 2-reductase [Mesorhizobium sp. CO1-1-8]|uniref:2-dehydropantoate 2-reductase n=1 Tax=Mesorhizobium sp. CO1-1-8 TaxID=2876631 RepID=UPI001CD144EA|nr:2-dehydropantoate 2-reductase [Mesorhizobium sp. CO1-1-8]MBZ9772313.1 2-dehydropantoate 2-reductase [Mesorhizobium sp. CO1-1-8]
MKICVVGAGAIGGLLAAKLAASEQDVTVIARGAHLEAIKESGLQLDRDGGETITAKVAATDNILDIAKQDLIILAVKAHQVAATVENLPSAFHDNTVVMTAQNGIPWWYFDGIGSPYAGRTLQSVDPKDKIRTFLPIEHVIGSVVYPAAEITAPGRVKHLEGNRFSLGEIDGSDTPRIAAISEALREAGFKAPVLTDIRSEIWTKLWGNLTFNPISALTHATLVDICQHPQTRALAADMMAEAQAVAEKLGVRFKVSLERRIAGAEAVGAHKTSMLQDVEAGRFLEIDALLGSVVELARLTETPTPRLDAIFACTKLLQQSLGNAGGRLRIEPN